MRSTAAALAAFALVCAAAPTGAAAAPRVGEQRVLIAFLPTKPAPKQPLLTQFQRRGMSIGLMSPTLGGFSRTQMALDISQGTRISTRAYTKKLPEVSFVPQGAGGAIKGWGDVARRADKAPGDILPGLLASTIQAGGGRVAYAGAVGTNQIEAIAVANFRGRVERASLGTIGTVAQRAVALWRRSSLVVTRLPDDVPGLRALDQILAARRSQDLVLVVRAPPQGLRLLPAGMIGPGFHGGELRSATTRRDGLVAATDVSPTILRFLGLKVPSKMEGEPITAVRGGSASQLQDLSARLDVVMTRRLSVFRDIVLAWLVVLGVMFAVRRGDGLRAGARIAFLGALWLPVIALVTAALRPGKLTESLISAVASVVLGAATDRLMPWPAAAALPAFASLGTYAVDLAAGSSLIGQALTGSNPKGGARFYGIGNELEIILSITTMVGAAAVLTYVPAYTKPRGFALIALIVAVIVGSGRLGADVGGVITLGAGAAAAVLASLPGGVTKRALGIAVAVPIAAVLGLILLDLATGGSSHLTRSVVHANSPGDLVDIVVRRLRLSTAGLNKGTLPISVGISIALLVIGAWRWRDLLEPLDAAPDGGTAFRAGLIGAWTCTVVGALANDSGPVIVLVGTVSLILAVLYARSAPRWVARRGRRVHLSY